MYGGLSVEALAVWRAEGVGFNYIQLAARPPPPPDPSLNGRHPDLVRVWGVGVGLSGLAFGLGDD